MGIKTNSEILSVLRQSVPFKNGTIPVPAPHLKKGTIPVPNSKETRNRSLELVPVPGTDPSLLVLCTIQELGNYDRYF